MWDSWRYYSLCPDLCQHQFRVPSPESFLRELWVFSICLSSVISPQPACPLLLLRRFSTPSHQQSSSDHLYNKLHLNFGTVFGKAHKVYRFVFISLMGHTLSPECELPHRKKIAKKTARMWQCDRALDGRGMCMEKKNRLEESKLQQHLKFTDTFIFPNHCLLRWTQCRLFRSKAKISWSPPGAGL